MPGYDRLSLPDALAHISQQPRAKAYCEMSRRDACDRSLARSAWKSVTTREPSRRVRCDSRSCGRSSGVQSAGVQVPVSEGECQPSSGWEVPFCDPVSTGAFPSSADRAIELQLGFSSSTRSSGLRDRSNESSGLRDRSNECDRSSLNVIGTSQMNVTAKVWKFGSRFSLRPGGTRDSSPAISACLARASTSNRPVLCS